MALVLLDRAKETTIVVGTTASAVLLGASPGYQSFAGVGNANTTYYCIADQSGGLNWEVGLGTYTLVGTTITRAATPLSSSNAGASVSFPAGTKDVFIVYPSSKGVWLDASGNAVGLGTPSALVGTNITGTATAFTASNVTTNANLTGAVTSVGNASSLGSFTSAQLATALTDETGSGANVFATSPTLITPALGTPSSGTLTNCTFPTLNQNTTGNAATVTNGIYTTTIDSYAVKRSNNAANINFNSYTSNSQVVGFDSANTNGPSGVVYSTMLVMQERFDTSSQFVIDYNTGHAFSRGVYLTTPTYSPWRTILDDGNYNSYSPALTGSGASGTWGIDVTGSSGSCTGNAATASNVIGNGQSWQNVLASRAQSVTYTNSTGRSILVSVGVRNTGTTYAPNLNIGGVIVGASGDSDPGLNAGGAKGQLTGIVPNGVTYILNASNSALDYWAELR